MTKRGKGGNELYKEIYDEIHREILPFDISSWLWLCVFGVVCRVDSHQRFGWTPWKIVVQRFISSMSGSRPASVAWHQLHDKHEHRVLHYFTNNSPQMGTPVKSRNLYQLTAAPNLLQVQAVLLKQPTPHLSTMLNNSSLLCGGFGGREVVTTYTNRTYHLHVTKCTSGLCEWREWGYLKWFPNPAIS